MSGPEEYTGVMLDGDVAKVVAHLQKEDYAGLNDEDTRDLANAILAGQPHVLGAFCAGINAQMSPWRMEPCDHLVPIQFCISSDVVVLVLRQETAPAGNNEPSRNRSFLEGIVHYLRVTENRGLVHIGTHEYAYRLSPVEASATASE